MSVGECVPRVCVHSILDFIMLRIISLLEPSEPFEPSPTQQVLFVNSHFFLSLHFDPLNSDEFHKHVNSADSLQMIRSLLMFLCVQICHRLIRNSLTTQEPLISLYVEYLQNLLSTQRSN